MKSQCYISDGNNALHMSYKPSKMSSIAFEIICELEIIDRELIEQAQWIAEKRNVPFGRALVLTGCFGEGDLTSLLQAAQLVRHRKITKTTAKRYLLQAIRECRPFLDLLLSRGSEASPASTWVKLLDPYFSAKCFIEWPAHKTAC